MNTLDKLLEILCGALLGLLSGALGLLACVMLTLLCGCSTPQPVVVERVVVKTDTLYKARTSADTFRLHDSVYVEHYTRGDTVYSQKSVWRWRDRISVKTDTVYKAMLQTDTTRLPIPVERKLSTWERTQMRVGQFTIGAVVLVVLSLLLWLIHRRR